MKRNTPILVSVVLILTSACGDPETAARELYDQALAAERNGNLGVALAQLEQVIVDYPQTEVAAGANERLTEWIVELQRNEATAIANLEALNEAERAVTELTQGGIYTLPSRLSGYGLLDDIELELVETRDVTAIYRLDGYIYTFTFNDLSLTGYTVRAEPEPGLTGRFSYYTGSEDFLIRYADGPGVTVGGEVQ